jgi:hypothetical protein
MQGAGCGTYQLYVRDLQSETTHQISSGPQPEFIRSTSDAAFFTTQGTLVAGDHGGNDVYRYDLDDESLSCLTCVSELPANVEGESSSLVAVSDDGSRLYFRSSSRLLPGVGGPSIYRLDVASRDLAYVGPATVFTQTGDLNRNGNALNRDGSVFIFRSGAAGLNSVNGPRNGGTTQLYRYDDDNRSLVCLSCPADGSPPRGTVPQELSNNAAEAGPNLSPLSSAGDIAFATPTALVAADQNTARPGQLAATGIDIYEWRDGRLLLVTDGLAVSQANPNGVGGSRPVVSGMTPSGRDIFFTQAAQLTPDAIDSYYRLYDARIGGGFDFLPPPPPCALEACQGTPKGAPEEAAPGSLGFAGAGNQASTRTRCRKGKIRRRGRCVVRSHKRSKHAQRKANHNRRAGR